MNKINWIFLIVSFTIIFSCSKTTHEKDTLTINADIKGLRKATVYLHQNVNGEIVPIDSLQLEDTETFTFTKKATHPDLYWIQIKNRVPMPVFVEPGTPVSLKAHMDSLHTYKAYGTQTQQDLNRFLSYMTDRDASYQVYYNNYALAVQNQDEYGAKQWLAKMKKNRESKTMIALNYATKNGKTQLSPFIALNYLPSTLQKRWYDSIYLNLNDSVKQTYFGKELGTYIKGMNTTQIGQAVSPIQIKDTKGQEYTIPVKNKRSVIYFWRTNNLQSRTDALFLNQLDSTTLKKADVFVVNLDHDIEQLKALSEFKDYNLPVIFSDRGIKSEIAQRFALRQVPGSVIIDKEGKIEALGLGASDIETYLENASN
ncbi:hypothetical protein UJ101_02066 [Flavobacteriaceae bacterium UJ101]|nr:hypothetical protein UJ101_02066 [Flavobacteriaceae bacterium UJ101]